MEKKFYTILIFGSCEGLFIDLNFNTWYDARLNVTGVFVFDVSLNDALMLIWGILYDSNLYPNCFVIMGFERDNSNNYKTYLEE